MWQCDFDEDSGTKNLSLSFLFAVCERKNFAIVSLKNILCQRNIASLNEA